MEKPTSNSARSIWSSRLGFILASAGSAVGLGAIWKFPYMAGTNGGSVFMLPYIFFTLTIGLVLLIGEMSMGRYVRKGAASAYKALGGRRWGWLGLVSVATGYFVLAFYSVVGGWCVYYLYLAATGNGAIEASQLGATFDAFVTSGSLPVLFHLIFLGSTALVVYMGVEKGIERVSKVLMPLLFFMMLALIIRGLTLPNSWEGIKFLFARSSPQRDGICILLAFSRLRFNDELRLVPVEKREHPELHHLGRDARDHIFDPRRIDDHACRLCIRS